MHRRIKAIEILLELCFLIASLMAMSALLSERVHRKSRRRSSARGKAACLSR